MFFSANNASECMRFLDFQLNDFRMSGIINIWTVGPGEEMKAERIVTLVILGVIDIFTWVKFQQVTTPWNSNIKPDEMAANDIKMGTTPSARYLTSQNATWNVIISVSSNCCIHATRLCNHLKNSILNFAWTVVLKLFIS